MTNLIINRAVVADTAVLGANLFAPADFPATGSAALLVGGDIELDDIAALLPRATAVHITFPKVTDGRGFSLAYLLRKRANYTGELRAVGAFTRDQLFYLERTGFNAMTLREGEDANAALAAMSPFSVRYQGSVDEPRALFEQLQREKPHGATA